MGLIFYNLFIILYKAGIILISPWNAKAKLWARGRKNIFKKIRAAVGELEHGPCIWMHCASLGEFEQGKPVVEQVKALYPNCSIILTFFSASGYEIRKNYEGADLIFYLPIDSPINAKRFITLIKPRLVIWVKYEYWYYYLAELKKQHIPTILISGNFRKEQLFFKWYGGLYRKILYSFSHIFVQTEESKRMLGTIGFTENITISGDTRFDRVIEIAEQFIPIPAIDLFCEDKKVIVAGSTWQADEEELDHFANTHLNLRFIIAPHEIDRPHLEEIKKLFHNAIFFTEWQSRLTDNNQSAQAMPLSGNSVAPNVLIIDNIGMLSRLYKYATIAYIGGGFGDAGVHNVLEAAVYGIPVIFGPVYGSFIEAEDLVDLGGAFSIDNALHLEEVFELLLKSAHEYTKACESARSYVYLKKGATEKIIDYLGTNYKF